MDEKILLQMEIIDAQLDLVNGKLDIIADALKLLVSCAVLGVTGAEDAKRVLNIGNEK